MERKKRKRRGEEETGRGKEGVGRGEKREDTKGGRWKEKRIEGRW